MRDGDGPVLRDIVLVGGGHSHVGVLRTFGMRPLPGVRVTLICTDTDTPYSGMLPGYIAGHYDYDDVHIDLRRLAQWAGARYYRDEVVGLDRTQRKVLCRSRPAIPYDVASLNIGSTPDLSGVPGASEHAVPVKPIRRFNERWLALLDRVVREPTPTTIAIVGAGAAGVETCLAMQYRLRDELRRIGRNPDELRFHLFSADPTILPTHNVAVRRAFDRILVERGVAVHLGAEVTEVEASCVRTGAGEVVAFDEILWVTQAGGAPWLRGTGLALDDRGFVRVRDTLQTETDPFVFAAGDCASLSGAPLEKAGVFAVRMGKPLAENLRRALLGRPPVRYRPQRKWLALITSGDRHAVVSRGALYLRGDWVWRWKDDIDRKFMRRFREFGEMGKGAAPPTDRVALDENETTQAISAVAMRCGGCGAKVGATVLSRALAEIRPIEPERVLVGLSAPDDAAVVKLPPHKALVQSVDFFRAFVDDPWLTGRIAANHALGDIFAMGAQPWTATAIVTLPPGLERKIEEALFQMLSGAVSVLNAAGCALVGGHTGEGSETSIGFAVAGVVDDDLATALRKGGLNPGDVLVLCKPIGTGTLLAAHSRLQARGRWIDAALESMQVSNRDAGTCFAAHGVRACTDVTGFGLLGHLVEMTKPSAVDAEIDLARIPILEGALEMARAGMASSLQPANVRLQRAIRDAEHAKGDPRFSLLFDPQTAGGLLAGVPAERADACIAALRVAGYAHAAVIGRVLPPGDAAEPIHVVSVRA